MGALTPEERTRLRARQIQRLHAAHVEKGPLKFAEAITTTDLNLARTLEPAWKHLGTDESEYPENWTLKKASLETALRSFRGNAPQLIASHVPDEVDVKADSKDQAQVANKTVGTEANGNPPFPLHVNHQEIIPAPLARKHTDQDYQEKDEGAGDRLDNPVNPHFDHNNRDRSVKRHSPYPTFISGGLGLMVDHETTDKAIGFDFLTHPSPSRHGHYHEPEVPQGNTNQSNMAMIELQALLEAKDEKLEELDNTVTNLNKECATWKQVAGEKDKSLQDAIKKLGATQQKLRQSEKDKLVLIEKERELVDKVKNMKLELAKTKPTGQGKDIPKKQQNNKNDPILTPSNLQRLQALMAKAGVERG